MSVDFPRGWQIARSAPLESHDPACSFVQAAGGMLCDCAVLLRHPEYLDDEMHGAQVGLSEIERPGPDAPVADWQAYWDAKREAWLEGGGDPRSIWAQIGLWAHGPVPRVCWTDVK